MRGKVVDETRKSEKILSDADKVHIAAGNHIWLSAFSLVRPSPEMLQEIGQMVIDKVLESEIADDFSGSFSVTWIRVNAS